MAFKGIEYIGLLLNWAACVILLPVQYTPQPRFFQQSVYLGVDTACPHTASAVDERVHSAAYACEDSSPLPQSVCAAGYSCLSQCPLSPSSSLRWVWLTPAYRVRASCTMSVLIVSGVALAGLRPLLP